VKNGWKGKEMCLAKAFLKKNNTEEFLLENVATVDILGKKIIITSILKETKEVDATISRIDFENGNILLEG